MNKRFIDYQEEHLKALQDPEEALAYLNAAFTDKDPHIFLLAIKNVFEAQNCSVIDLTKVVKLTYKKYVGNVVYYDDAKIFHGEVINLKDVITFQGSTIQELEKAFKDSVNDYLVWCKERSEAPEKTFSNTFRLRMTQDLHAHLAMEDLEDLYDIQEAEKILAKDEEEKGRTLEEIEESLHKKN
jgi:predicted HicB family RNase H-like nuclease